jgi:uncharacterized protein (TIGR02301 family)
MARLRTILTAVAAVGAVLMAGASGLAAQEAAKPRTLPLPDQTALANAEIGPVPRPAPRPTWQERRGAYDADARELAHVMGAAHYLRWLCFGRRDQMWRQFMGDLLDIEDQRLRGDLARAFNEGFDAERVKFDSCSARAQASEQEWKAKGLKLADGLGARHRD